MTELREEHRASEAWARGQIDLQDRARNATSLRSPTIDIPVGNRIEYVLDNAGNKTGQSVKDPGGNLARSLARSIDPLGRVQQTTGRE